MAATKRRNWIPGVGVGQLEFGQPLDLLIKSCGLIPEDPKINPYTGRECFLLPAGDVSAYFENGKLIAIACRDNCFWGNVDLIGMPICRASSLFGIDPEIEDLVPGESGTMVYSFSDLGAMFFVEEDLITDITLDLPEIG